MRSLFITLTVGMLAMGTAQSQTQSTTDSTNATTITGQSSGQPAAAAPNRRQELYDQYHGITKKPASLTSVELTTRPTNQPASQPVTSVPADGAERPLSSDVSTSAVRIGVRGGATYPVYLETFTGDVDPTVSFVGGFVVNVGKGTFSFQPELNYARYAFKRSDLSFGGSTTNTFAVDRFEVPLLLKIASGSVNSTRFFLHVGPYGAYVAGASLNGQKISLDGSTGRFTFGAAAGIGAAFKAGSGHFTLELRGLYDLGDGDNGVGVNAASRVLNTQATVGYMFPLGGR